MPVALRVQGNGSRPRRTRFSRQNRRMWLSSWRLIQKFNPSLQAPPAGFPTDEKPSGLKSAPFQSETFLPPLVTSIRSPSNAAITGSLRPLPVSVARTAPLESRTTEIELERKFGTQMFVPSKPGSDGPLPTVTVTRTAPELASFKSVPAEKSVTHMFAPS